jgi:hypothetical protein
MRDFSIGVIGIPDEVNPGYVLPIIKLVEMLQEQGLILTS